MSQKKCKVDNNLKLKEIYDTRYLGDYRKSLSGYEVARWKALDHLISRILKLKNIGHVLDYGSGSGLHVELWKHVFLEANLYFCDISSVALQQLGDKYPEFKSKCGEVKRNRAPFDDLSFDVVISVEVMEHVENLDDYLEDIFRLLKPGGIFIWTAPCANRFSIEHIFNIITNQIEKTSEGYRRWKWEEPAHLRRLKSDEVKKKLEEIGFDEIGFRFRAHFFSFVCTILMRGPLRKIGEKMMLLDFSLFRLLPNGASMIGFAKKLRGNMGCCYREL